MRQDVPAPQRSDENSREDKDGTIKQNLKNKEVNRMDLNTEEFRLTAANLIIKLILNSTRSPTSQLK